MSETRRILAGVVIVLAVGAALRTVWLTADPPTHATLGIVWHDEGPWVHNARNRALWGTWRTDEWNPVFIAPVFTALEYAAFSAFGVGTWQARTVPVASGLLAIAAIAAGLFVTAGGRSALIGAAFLATNYVFVMWNRVALMESTMTAFIVVSWACYAAATESGLGARGSGLGSGRAWGFAAGAAATLAFYSKAAAAFFAAAIALEASVVLLLSWSASIGRRLGVEPPSRTIVRGAVWTLAGLAASAVAIGVVFVLPYWNEYQFYNWQVSVSRKPSYTVQAMLDRATWLPVIHDFFTRMWLVMVAAAIAVFGIFTKWRTATPGERLLVLWLVLGLLELVVHDAGNERRYVMFIPALVALAALTLGAPRSLFSAEAAIGRWRWIALPVFAVLAYLAIGSLVRLPFLADVRNNEFSMTVRLSAALAAIAAGGAVLKWQSLALWLARQPASPRAFALVALLVILSDIAQYAQWARGRTDYNYRASIEVGRLLPPGTLAQGKLANGLALENRIQPVFIGRGFGNYADRATRSDVQYVLTYISPSLGYESQAANPIIKDVLDASPGWRIVETFEVRETEGGRDRAALIDKWAGR